MHGSGAIRAVRGKWAETFHRHSEPWRGITKTLQSRGRRHAQRSISGATGRGGGNSLGHDRRRRLGRVGLPGDTLMIRKRSTPSAIRRSCESASSSDVGPLNCGRWSRPPADGGSGRAADASPVVVALDPAAAILDRGLDVGEDLRAALVLGARREQEHQVVMVGSLAMASCLIGRRTTIAGARRNPAQAGKVAFNANAASRATFSALDTGFVGGRCAGAALGPVIRVRCTAPHAQGRPPDRRVRRPGGLGALAARQPRLRPRRVAEDRQEGRSGADAQPSPRPSRRRSASAGSTASGPASTTSTSSSGSPRGARAASGRRSTAARRRS